MKQALVVRGGWDGHQPVEPCVGHRLHRRLELVRLFAWRYDGDHVDGVAEGAEEAEEGLEEVFAGHRRDDRRDCGGVAGGRGGGDARRPGAAGRS